MNFLSAFSAEVQRVSGVKFESAAVSMYSVLFMRMVLRLAVVGSALGFAACGGGDAPRNCGGETGPSCFDPLPNEPSPPAATLVLVPPSDSRVGVASDLVAEVEVAGARISKLAFCVFAPGQEVNTAGPSCQDMDLTPILAVAGGERGTLTMSWTPTAAGQHNFTAYAITSWEMNSKQLQKFATEAFGVSPGP